MERNLLSQQVEHTTKGLIVASVVLLLGFAIYITAQGGPVLLMLIVIVYAIVASIQSLRRMLRWRHPVYFDEQFLYWAEGDGENKILLAQIIKMNIRRAYKTEIKFKTGEGEKGAVGFMLIDTDLTSNKMPPLLYMLQEYVQRSNPEFKIKY